jgi:NAD-dependent dihydropyrimidine dehydrogenase PreA subunit
MNGFDKQDFFTRFAVPAQAEMVIDQIVTPAEQRVIALLPPEPFSTEALYALNEGVNLQSLYRRGIVNYADGGLFTFTDFYTRMEIFVVSEIEVYRAFTEETRKALDGWYFSAYYARLNIYPDKTPTDDAVLTKDETVLRVRNETRQAYLAYCDCRSLAADYNRCEAPLQTCISFRDGINTNAHRGVSKRITKDEAVKIILDADKAGLMHTANGHSICNCCTDCCYLSRARKRRAEELKPRRNIRPDWPKISKRVRVDWEKCAVCGLCEKRCPFHLFNTAEKRVDSEQCIGCSLCVNTCPKGALYLEKIKGA